MWQQASILALEWARLERGWKLSPNTFLSFSPLSILVSLRCPDSIWSAFSQENDSLHVSWMGWEHCLDRIIDFFPVLPLFFFAVVEIATHPFSHFGFFAPTVTLRVHSKVWNPSFIFPHCECKKRCCCMENGKKKDEFSGSPKRWRCIFARDIFYLSTNIYGLRFSPWQLSDQSFKNPTNCFAFRLGWLAHIYAQGVGKNFFFKPTQPRDSEGWDRLWRTEQWLEAKSNNRKVKWSITLQKKTRAT